MLSKFLSFIKPVFQQPPQEYSLYTSIVVRISLNFAFTDYDGDKSVNLKEQMNIHRKYIWDGIHDKGAYSRPKKETNFKWIINREA